MSTGSVPRKVKLDKIDRKIISDLQANGRMTNVDLADRSGISAPPCLRRVRSLEDNDIILGYHANTNAKKLGYGVTAFVTVRLENQGETALNKFEEEITALDYVREAYMISGDYDYMLRVVARDWEEFQQFITNKLSPMENVASMRSAMTVKTSKYAPGVPIDLD